MNSVEVVDIPIYGQGNLEIVLDNFKHGHYISFVRNVLNKRVNMIEDYESKKRFFREEDKEYIDGKDDEKLLYKLEDKSIIIIEPLRLESKIRFEFKTYAISKEEADKKLIALRETVLNYIDY